MHRCKVVFKLVQLGGKDLSRSQCLILDLVVRRFLTIDRLFDRSCGEHLLCFDTGDILALEVEQAHEIAKVLLRRSLLQLMCSLAE